MRKLYRMKPGSWQQAHLTSVDVVLIIWAAISQVWLRVWDYSTGNDSGSTSLTLVERAAPLWVWSLGFGAGALILTVGVVTRRHLMVWLGHGWLWIAYSVLAVGIIIPCLTRPYLDGLRGATVLILPVTLHWLLMRRTGPKPLRATAAHAEEEVAAP